MVKKSQFLAPQKLDAPLEDHKLWTFLVQGGEEFYYSGEGNPPISHNGHRTVWKTILTEHDAEIVEGIFRLAGAEITRSCYIPNEVEDRERKQLLDLRDDSKPFKSKECFECFFLDPFSEEKCGIFDWPREKTEAALKHFDKARSDLAKCPVQKK